MNITKLNTMIGMVDDSFSGLRHPHHPLPPHVRKEQIHVSFNEADWAVLFDVFGDEDTAVAAAKIIQMAPPEMQVVAFQLLDIIEEVA